MNKIQTVKNNIATGIRSVLPVVVKGNPRQPASHILLTGSAGEFWLTGCNYFTQVKVRVAEARIEGEVNMSVPGHFLKDLVGAMKSEIEIMPVDDEAVAVVTGGQGWKSTSTIRAALPGEHFPYVIFDDSVPPLVVPASTLLEAVTKVYHFVMKEEKYHEESVLQGVNIVIRDGNITSVGTDKKTLATMTEPVALPDMEMVIDAQALAVLIKHLPDVDTVSVYLNHEKIMFRLPGFELVGKLLSGGFPDYERVIPKDKLGTVTVSKQALMEALDKLVKLSLYADKEKQFIRFSFTEDRIVLESNNLFGSAQTETEAKIDGSPCGFHLFTSQLTKALNAIDDTAEIEIGVTEGFKNKYAGPVVMSVGNHKQIIMPLNLEG